LYTTIGRVLRVTDASRYPLRAAISWALRFGDVRIVYRAPDGRMFQLDLARDGGAGCIAVGRGMLQGRQCLQELARHVGARSGTIEIIQLTPQLVNVDLKSWPQSVIPGGVAEVARVLGIATQQAPPTRLSPTAAQPQPLRPRPVAPAAPPAPQPQPQLQRPVQQPPAAAKPTVRLPPGYQVDELFNHLEAAAIVVKGDKLTAHVEGKSCADSVIDALSAIPGRAYIVCRNEHGSLHVIVKGRRVSAIYESNSDGRLLAGMEALEKAAGEEAREAHVYIDR
jgi:hypothetical protein